MRKITPFHFMVVIILFSIATLCSELLLLHFVPIKHYAFLLCALLLIIFSHIILFFTCDFEAAFLYLLLLSLLSTGIFLVNFLFGEVRPILNGNDDFLLLLMNFLLPCIYAWIRNLLGSNRSSDTYRSFFQNSSILFFIFYLAFFVFLEFWYISGKTTLAGVNFLNRFTLLYPSSVTSSSSQANFIPFYTAAGYIEDYIYQLGSFTGIFGHLLLPVGIYIPLGYYFGLWLRSFGTLFKIILFCACPLLVELLQSLFETSAFNLDDIIYGFIGIVIGILFFYLMNRIYYFFNGQDFMEAHDGHESSLHF